jgi:hypothetical protein
MRRQVAAAIVLASVTFGAAPSEAQLERVGPIAPTHGFPAWYQDKSGLALEFCQPSTPAELADGWCLLLPGDTSVPEAFPAQFADEHFYWAAQAAVDFTAAGVSGKVVLALEAAFAQGSPAAGIRSCSAVFA